MERKQADPAWEAVVEPDSCGPRTYFTMVPLYCTMHRAIPRTYHTTPFHTLRCLCQYRGSLCWLPFLLEAMTILGCVMTSHVHFSV